MMKIIKSLWWEIDALVECPRRSNCHSGLDPESTKMRIGMGGSGFRVKPGMTKSLPKTNYSLELLLSYC